MHVGCGRAAKHCRTWIMGTMNDGRLDANRTLKSPLHNRVVLRAQYLRRWDDVAVPDSALARAPVAGARTASSPLRHAAVIRVTHWMTALCFLALLVSWIEIVISHPRFYRGETGNVNAPARFVPAIPFRDQPCPPATVSCFQTSSQPDRETSARKRTAAPGRDV